MKRNGKRSRLYKVLANFDRMGQDIAFKIRGEHVFPSYLGLVLSFVLCVLTALYGYFLFMSLIEYGNTQEMEYVVVNDHNPDAYVSLDHINHTWVY